MFATEHAIMKHPITLEKRAVPTKGFNLWAFLFTWIWFLVKRMYGMALLFFFLVPLINFVVGCLVLLIYGGIPNTISWWGFIVPASFVCINIFLGFRSYPMLYNFHLINGWKIIGMIPGSYTADRALVEYETSFKYEIEKREKEREEAEGLEKLAQELLQD